MADCGILVAGRRSKILAI
ncbi:hypothetical protein [Liquorilactobacillus uvarum]